MEITDVRIRLTKKDDSKLKAVAAITIDGCFVVHDIKIIQGTEGYFIAMPSRKTNEGDYKDIAHPINIETREMIFNLVLDAFKKELAASEAEAQ